MTIKLLGADDREGLDGSVRISNVEDAVRELVQNAVDGGATRVRIYVNSDDDVIEVCDNGEGINVEDFLNVGRIYATSKYPPDGRSFGYRGVTIASLTRFLKRVVICTVPRLANHPMRTGRCYKKEWTGGVAQGNGALVVSTVLNSVIAEGGTSVKCEGIHAYIYGDQVLAASKGRNATVHKIIASVVKAIMFLPDVDISISDCSYTRSHIVAAARPQMNGPGDSIRWYLQLPPLWGEHGCSSISVEQKRRSLRSTMLADRCIETDANGLVYDGVFLIAPTDVVQASTAIRDIPRMIYILGMEVGLSAVISMDAQERFRDNVGFILNVSANNSASVSLLLRWRYAGVSGYQIGDQRCVTDSILQLLRDHGAFAGGPAAFVQRSGTMRIPNTPSSSVPASPSDSTGHRSNIDSSILSRDLLQLADADGEEHTALQLPTRQWERTLEEDTPSVKEMGYSATNRGVIRRKMHISNDGNCRLRKRLKRLDNADVSTVAVRQPVRESVVGQPSHASVVGASSAPDLQKEYLKDCKVIGVVHNELIVAEACNSSLLLAFDQHAVDERIRLELFMADFSDRFRTQKVRVSVHIPPIRVCLRPLDHLTVTREWKYLRRLGFRLELLTSDSNSVSQYYYHLHSSPRLTAEHQHGLGLHGLQEVLHSLESGYSPSKLPPFIMDVMKSRSCRGAIKFGDSISIERATNLIHSLSTTKFPYICAHGRPSVALLSVLPPCRRMY